MPLLDVTNLTKSYSGVRALSNIDLEIDAGEIHAICGENGAGKSTLIKCLTGTVHPDDGAVHINGQALRFGSVQESEAAGIAVMHQESTAFPDLTAVDNIFVGRELRRWHGWRLDHRKMQSETNDLMNRLGQNVKLDRPVRELSVANRQMISMARALSQQCKLLIMDEPTASLSDRETRALLQICKELRAAGVSILYVSHRLEEIFTIADRVTVLRDGAKIETRKTKSLQHGELVSMMVGRTIQEHDRRPSAHSAPTGSTNHDAVLSIDRLTRDGSFRDISLSVRRGEVVGLAGLVGAGRSEVVKAIFGIDAYDSGTVTINGEVLPGRNPRVSADRGIALVPEDRQHEGLVLQMSIKKNISFAALKRLTRFGLIRRRAETKKVAALVDQLQVKMANANNPAQTLSGGNQQKLVLAKWLATTPSVLILDEPTRGVDVGAKAQFHDLIRQLASDGMATLVISSELPELLSVCDRILVMREGRIVDEVGGSDATEERILRSALPNSEGAN